MEIKLANTERLNDMLKMRFIEKKTLKEIGNMFGISRQRVHEIIGNTKIERAPKRVIMIDKDKIEKTRSYTSMLKFWSHVKIKGINDCWEWNGFKDGGGYGRFGNHYLNSRYAHHLAYIYVFGKPKNQVLHSCSNSSCCNPRHLYDGTILENMRDRDKIGRGRKNGLPKLFTLEEANEIRKIYNSNRTSILALSKAYKISYVVMFNLIKNKTYKNT